MKLDPEISLVSNFQTKINYNNKSSKKINLFKDFKYYKNIQNLEADLDNNVMINFDETYKIKKYEFKNKGKISNLDMNLENEIKNSFFKKKLAYFSLKNSEIKLNFDSKKENINISGKYSLNRENYLNFNLSNSFDKELSKLKLDIDYDEIIDLSFINYQKPKGKFKHFN